MTWFDGYTTHYACFPVPVASRYAPLLLTAQPSGLKFVYSGQQERPFFPLTPLEAVIDVST